ncbi:MAG: gluconolaconase [Leptolyngbyaceae cyanobacterium SL_5_9]|nr:gluconolaconase [Leptolyngbyaceae cyanobacterium SL_5_9]NJO73605.1 gluconolaconase [Leptolyngbyaceae cyanobacterium RM1_406_9]
METPTVSPLTIHMGDSTSANILASIELPANFQYPNGIARASDSTLYVGSIISGQILRITPEGRTETFFSGSDEVFAATSLRRDESRGILWGASPDFLGIQGANGEVTRRSHRIFAINTRSGELLKVIPMPNGGFGNDMAIDPTGGVYVTDSSRPRIHYLPPEAMQFQTWAEDEQFRSEEIGLAGIALHSSGVLVVGKYSEGELFKLTPQPQGQPIIEPIFLSRELENPDGMQFAPDGSLLVIEGSIESGNGRLLQIDVLSPQTEPRLVETLAENLESPVNLTVSGQKIWISEARIRHRLLPGQENNIPDRFFIRKFMLQPVRSLS